MNIAVLFNMTEYLNNCVSDQIIASFVVIFLLCIACVLLGKKIDKLNPTDKIPKIITFLELITTLINNFVRFVIGEKRWKSFAPYILTVAIYLTFANLMGLTGVFVPPTSSWNVTLGLALITFFLIHSTGIRSTGLKKYINSYFSPIFLLFPVNLIGEVAFPVSLSLRLFGNILSGCVISIMVYGLAAQAGWLGFLFLLATPFMHMIFDVFFGIIQVVVFVLLSTIFIGQKIDETELDY